MMENVSQVSCTPFTRNHETSISGNTVNRDEQESRSRVKTERNVEKKITRS